MEPAIRSVIRNKSQNRFVSSSKAKKRYNPINNPEDLKKELGSSLASSTGPVGDETRQNVNAVVRPIDMEDPQQHRVMSKAWDKPQNSDRNENNSKPFCDFFKVHKGLLFHLK